MGQIKVVLIFNEDDERQREAGEYLKTKKRCKTALVTELVHAWMKNGETAVRTGVGNNGWSRIIYNGQTVYCVSNYLTTDLSYVTPQETESEFKTKFTDVSENVTAKEVTNLRNRPSVESPSEVIAELKNGEVIVRTGVSNEGWSRVEYNGQTLYCISSYLEVVQ